MTNTDNKEAGSGLRKRTKPGTSSSDAMPKTETSVQQPRTRKQLPSVSDLLAYGPEETRGQPKTWYQVFCLPVTLAVIFAISLLIFHHAPHHKSTRRSHVLPKVVQDLQEQRLARKQRAQQANSFDPKVEEVEPVDEENDGSA